MRVRLIAFAALGVCLAACSQGSAEKAGENADTAIENATQGSKDLSDGPMENAGEAIDKATPNAESIRP